MTADADEDPIAFLRRGVALGWWEDIDEAAVLPVRVFRISDFHPTALLAHAWLRLGVFDSIKQAKRAGWDRPLETGTFRKGTRIMRIEA